MLDPKPPAPTQSGAGDTNARQQFARALDLYGQGNTQEAARICEAFIRRSPRHFGAFRLLGEIAFRARHYRRAAAMLSRAVALNPAAAGAQIQLGDALRLLARPKQALACYDKAIALKPELGKAHFGRGETLRALKRPRRALESYDKAIALSPAHFQAQLSRGLTLHVLGRFADALESYDRAIGLQPNSANTHLNRGVMLHNLDRLEEALDSFEKALSLNPDFVAAFFYRGHALRGLYRLDDAMASYGEAMARDPNHTLARLSRGNCLLLRGNYEEGLEVFEQRESRSNLLKAQAYTQPLWLGEEDIAGKTLFIRSEMFLGDMMQFCRYAKLAEERGAKVVLSAQNALHELLRTLSPTIEIIAQDAVPEQFDLHCPLMSLPFAFKTRLETIPATVPYLHADPGRIESWKSRLGDDGFKIGVCWQGSKTAYAARLRRSFPRSMFRNISRLAGVRLISLQKPETVPETMAELPDDIEIETFGQKFDAGPQAFLDAAAVMESLDLVITTDTAVAHLAGALARPTWLVLRDVPDWRWMLNRTDSPWYPTMRLFRQTKRNDWKSAFDDVEAALKEVLEERHA